MDSVLKTFRLKDVLIISFISVLYIAGLKGFLPFDENISEVNKYDISKIYDYAVIPKKAKDNIDYIRNRDKEVAVLEGNSEIYEKSKMLTFYSFRATTIAKDTVYELPFLYYPGYEIRYDGIKTDYFESPNGMIAIKMDPEEDTHFEVRYIGTELMNFCKILSFTSLIVFCIYVYKKH